MFQGCVERLIDDDECLRRLRDYQGRNVECASLYSGWRFQTGRIISVRLTFNHTGRRSGVRGGRALAISTVAAMQSNRTTIHELW